MVQFGILLLIPGVIANSNVKYCLIRHIKAYITVLFYGLEISVDGLEVLFHHSMILRRNKITDR